MQWMTLISRNELTQRRRLFALNEFPLSAKKDCSPAHNLSEHFQDFDARIIEKRVWVGG